ncbi:MULTISPECIES: glycoside hydrolase family 13 protein [unclassified Arthrobacter]|uniref:glycoside hydrolase family 13 protein n=1 Tax=unclassified Arthrobacter TaxID=235627 RepID=UPI002E090544|nr:MULTISPECIES: alpha-glucosidase [unclassified Arthrobacter]MEC5191785.1 oligo-1,6-glucosidase [Arthrobacter sp. MP_M4]MEC5203475.1 oligo-1,6-glucosidase [Arthrobacter sp. MP_M7]
MTVEQPTNASAEAPARDWFQSAVVYQIYPRSFADANGDGIGDLRGIISKLDYLHRLGVDVVWLSPIYTSPQDDNGYDISDYRTVDPIFGTLEELRELTDGLHARGMKLVMDLVVNHTSDEHPWFVESRSSQDNPKRDWYWWRPPRDASPGSPGSGAEPNNWGSAFSGPAWEFDKATGEYYLHLFSRKQPDLNWENPEVRAAVYEMMNWWLDRGVDGFRMDVINFISKDTALPDGPIAAGMLYGDGTPFYIGGPRIHEFLQEMHREVFAGRPGPLLTVGEMPGVTVDEAILFTDPERAEVDMVFQFEHVALDQENGNKWRPRKLKLTDLKATLGHWQTGLAERGWNSLYWGNHDQARAVSRFGDDGTHRELSAKMLAGILHLHRGTPYVYQGEELGMTNMTFGAISDYRDIEVLNHHREATTHLGHTDADVLAALAPLNRDNARTPVQWDASQHAGFTTGSPWIAVNPNANHINAADQVDDPDSVYSFYRKVIGLRHSEPVVSHGDFTMLLPRDEHVYAFVRSLPDTKLLVLGNFSGQDQQVALDGADVPLAWDSAELVLANYPADAAVPRLHLRPWELKVFRAEASHPS